MARSLTLSEDQHGEEREHPEERVHGSKRTSGWESFGMPPLVRWSWVYRRSGSGVGRQFILVCRHRPRKEGDTNWIAVTANRALEVIDVKDRGPLSVQREPNREYEVFPALTRRERPTSSSRPLLCSRP